MQHELVEMANKGSDIHREEVNRMREECEVARAKVERLGEKCVARTKMRSEATRTFFMYEQRIALRAGLASFLLVGRSRYS